MTTSSNGNIFRVTGLLCGEFTGHRWIPRTSASDTDLWFFFDLRLNKRLSKQSWGWWIETPPLSLWRHCNGPISSKVISTCSSEWIMRCLNELKAWFICRSVLCFLQYRANLGCAVKRDLIILFQVEQFQVRYIIELNKFNILRSGDTYMHNGALIG